MLAYGDTLIFGMPMLKTKDILPDSNPWWKHNFDIEVNGQGHTESMNVRDTSHYGNTLACQTKYDYSKGHKKLWPEHKDMS